MSKEATAYIFSFDSKSGVFTLTSSKDQLTIDSKHKKYEWLKGQESGRVIKISATGRWNSSRDYDNLYQSIKPKKKVLKKSKTSKTNTDKAGEYCFSFRENEFVLTDQNGREIKITSKHKKFEWLESQDSGRVIKISEKGRWNSSKDYDGLYQIVKSSHKKQTKPKTQKPKTDSSGEIKKLKEEIKNLQSTIQNQRDELKRLGSNYNELKKDKEALGAKLVATEKAKKDADTDRDKYESLYNKYESLYTGELAKSLLSKTKPSKPKKVIVPKEYIAKIVANYSYISFFTKKKETDTLNVEITTQPQNKPPTQSFFKAYLKLVSKDVKYKDDYYLKGQGIKSVNGLYPLDFGGKKRKISGIEFIDIKEY